MARTVRDDQLRVWEVFASTGPYGYADHARVVFNCTDDPGVRPRALAVPGDKSDVETRVATASGKELLEMLSAAEALA
jgi:hypothetical protein